MKKDKIYSCKLHVEIALDDFVNEVEVAPEISKLQENGLKCQYCSEEAEYEIKK